MAFKYFIETFVHIFIYIILYPILTRATVHKIDYSYSLPLQFETTVTWPPATIVNWDPLYVLTNHLRAGLTL